MRIDPQVEFKRARKGYDPQEVDVAFDTMLDEIKDLEQEKFTLLDAITQYTAKIEQFADAERRLEEEMDKGVRRLPAVRVRENELEVSVRENAAHWFGRDPEMEKASMILQDARLYAQAIIREAINKAEMGGVKFSL